MSGYLCPCCRNFIATMRMFQRRQCPHCEATVDEQIGERFGLIAQDLPGGIFDDREDH